MTSRIELKALKGRRWWRVITGYSNSEGERDLGIHYGTLTEVAWSLADEARGFWEDHGHLEFHPVDEPSKAKKKSGRSRKVNISVYPGKDRCELTEDQLRELVDRGSHIEPSNYYAQAYLVKDVVRE